MQKAPVAVHHRSACSGVKALRNTSAAKRQAAKPWLAFRSLDPFRALREPDRRRRDEERPCRSEQKTATNQNDYLTGKAPYKSCKPSVPERLRMFLRITRTARFSRSPPPVTVSARRCPHVGGRDGEDSCRIVSGLLAPDCEGTSCFFI